MSAWHGWKPIATPTDMPKVVSTSPSLHAGPLPGRKSIALYTEGSGTIETLAYFQSDKAAEVVMDFIDRLAWPDGKRA